MLDVVASPFADAQLTITHSSAEEADAKLTITSTWPGITSFHVRHMRKGRKKIKGLSLMYQYTNIYCEKTVAGRRWLSRGTVTLGLTHHDVSISSSLFPLPVRTRQQPR